MLDLSLCRKNLKSVATFVIGSQLGLTVMASAVCRLPQQTASAQEQTVACPMHKAPEEICSMSTCPMHRTEFPASHHSDHQTHDTIVPTPSTSHQLFCHTDDLSFFELITAATQLADGVTVTHIPQHALLGCLFLRKPITRAGSVLIEPPRA